MNRKFPTLRKKKSHACKPCTSQAALIIEKSQIDVSLPTYEKSCINISILSLRIGTNRNHIRKSLAGPLRSFVYYEIHFRHNLPALTSNKRWPVTKSQFTSRPTNLPWKTVIFRNHTIYKQNHLRMKQKIIKEWGTFTL